MIRFMFNVGERIKFLRKERGLKGIVVAKEAGFSHPFLYGIENNTKKCSIENLEKICTVLGISLSEFFTDEAPKLSAKQTELLNLSKQLTDEQLEKLIDFISCMKKH